MGMAFSGDTLQLAVWLEISAWGGDVETAYILPVKNDGVVVGETIERIESSIANGTREEGDRYDGKISATGLKFTVIASYESYPWLLRLIAGAMTSSAGPSPYVHTRAGFGDLTEGFGCEIALVDTTTAADSVLYTCKGCEVTGFTEVLSGVAGQREVTITFDAKSVTRTVDTPISGTTFTEGPILLNDMTVLTINDGDGADSIVDNVSASLELSCPSGMVHIANNGGRVGFRYRRAVKSRLKLQMVEHKDSAYAALAAARTPCTVIVTMTTGATAIYTVTLTNVVLGLQPTNVGTNEVLISCDGDCDPPSWSITNTTATYPTPV